MILRVLPPFLVLSVSLTGCCCLKGPAPQTPPDVPPVHKTATPKHGEVLKRSTAAKAKDAPANASGSLTAAPAPAPAGEHGEKVLASVKEKVGTGFFKTAESATVEKVTIYSRQFIRRPDAPGAGRVVHSKGPSVALLGDPSAGSIKVLVTSGPEGSMQIDFEDGADPAIDVKGTEVYQLDGDEIQPWRNLIRHR